MACVSGTWDAITAKEIFGDGYAATKLPTFTVGDKQVQQGSVAGYKYVGVNGYSENSGWAVPRCRLIQCPFHQDKGWLIGSKIAFK